VTILLSVILLLLVVGAMSIGVIMGRKPIQGSCGGLNAVGINGDCEICGGNPNKCENVDKQDKSAGELAVDATEKNRES
jgi:hypothetical protein